MKKTLTFIIVIWILWIGFVIYKGINLTQKEKTQNQVVNSNFELTKQYLIKNFKWNYPIPTWDLILLDKTKSLIHLEDRNTPLNKIKDLYIIQATTCDILKNDETFQKFAFDPNNGLWEIKRCFTYAITADRKNFQIWTIINQNWQYIAKIDWTTKEPITKSYNSPRLVKNGSNVDLPYPPKLSPVIIWKNLWKSKIFADITDNKTFEKNKIQITNGINYLISYPSAFDIKIYWKADKLTQLIFVDTKGNIIYIKWNSDWKINFEVKDYEIRWKKKDYIANAWKFLANILKLAPDNNITVSNKWTTLVIRWTKFSIDVNNDEFSTFLLLWKIIQSINWNKINLTLDNAFSILKNNKLIENLEKIKQIASFAVLSDVLNNPKWKYTINTYQLSDILSWASSIKRYSIKYENSKNIQLITIELHNQKNRFDSILIENKNKFNLSKIYNKIQQQNGKWKDRLYKNLVDNICKAYNLKWLDISKIWYLLDANKDNFKLQLKPDIKTKLSLNNDYIILTSRHYNWQNSQVLSYYPEDSLWIRTISLPWLNYDDKISKIIIACEK